MPAACRPALIERSSFARLFLTFTVRASLFSLLICTAALAQQPRIDSVSPSQGPIAGGTVITISGANFGGATVTLDRKGIALLSQSDTTIRVQMPPHDNGYAIFAVKQPSGSAYGRFLYVAPPLSDLPAGSITTIAGIGAYGGDYGPATEASLRTPEGIAFDAQGTIYFAETGNNRVDRIGPGGILEPFAGNGLNGPHPGTPSPALDVGTSYPHNIAFDSHGNLIVPDAAYYLWRVAPNGTAELIAGNGQLATSVTEGVPAKGTAIGYPNYVAVDADDNIYFIDWTNARVRKIDKAGMLTTVAGNGTFGFSGDGGPATSAQFDLREETSDSGGLAVDHHGNLLLLDRDNRRIRRVSLSTGIIDTVAGPSAGGRTLSDLWALAVGPDDTLYFSSGAEIYKRTADGTVTRIQSGPRGFSEDGSALPTASVGKIYALAVDSAGNILYSDSDINRVRKIESGTGRISTIAGSGPGSFGEGGPANAAALDPGDVKLRSGQILLADNDRIHAIGSDGRLVRIAGRGTFGAIADVPALDAIVLAFSLFVSPDGSIDYAGYNLGTFLIDPTGIVHRTAGKIAVCDFSGDQGDALNGGLCQSFDAIRDPERNLYIADANNNRVRRVDAKTGVITTFAGSGPVNGKERMGAGSTCGDGGAATSACINTPEGLTFDDRGGLLISENQQRVRRVDPAGTISTFAIARCTKMTWTFGKVFCVGGDRVEMISRTGEVAELTSGGLGFAGDGGPATAAKIEAQGFSNGLAVDGEGNLFFADGFNRRLRAIRYGALLAPAGATIQASATGTTIRATVSDSHGHPAEGVRVDFAAPQSGPSCFLSTPFAITDATGVAAVSCTPNCTQGTYNVTARPLTSSATGTVSLTNGPCPRRRSVRH